MGLFRGIKATKQSTYITFVENIQSRVKRWKISGNNDCELCKCPETPPLIFNDCKLELDRYEWRHNSVISTICSHLKTKVTNNLLQLYVDIYDNVNPATLFKKRNQAITTNMYDNLRHRARPDTLLKTTIKSLLQNLLVHIKPIQKNDENSKKEGMKTSKTSASLQRQILN